MAQATVFNPQTGQRKAVTVGDPNAFAGGFVLETPTQNLQTYKPPTTPTTAAPSATSPAPAAGVTPPAAPTTPAAPTVDTNQTGFLGAFNKLLNVGQQTGAMQDQKRLLLQQLYDQPLTPEQLRTLSPSQQEAIRSGNKQNLEFQVMTLNDQIKGRADENLSAMQYMVQGYQADQAALQKKQQDAYDRFAAMIDKYPDVAAAMSPAGFAAFQAGNMPPASDVQAAYGAYKTSVSAEKAMSTAGKPFVMGQTTDAYGNKINVYGVNKFDPTTQTWSIQQVAAPDVPVSTTVSTDSSSGGSGIPGGGTPGQNQISWGGKTYDFASYAQNDDGSSNLSWGDGVTGILQSIQQMNNGQGFQGDLNQVQQYIDSNSMGTSPITADMISKASEAYGVPWEVMVAVMQQESHFGTDGQRAISGMNPGNIGNTNSGAAQKFGSWQDGVNAVASQVARRDTSKYQTSPSGDVTPKLNDTFLKTLPTNIASQVKAIAEYRQPPPTARGAKTSPLLGYVQQYDPSYDANQYPVRQKFITDWTSGNLSKNINLGNTGIKHLAKAQEEFQALQNTEAWGIASRKGMSIKNFLKQQANDPAYAKVIQDLFAAGDEMAGFYAAGAGNASPGDSDKQAVHEALTPDQPLSSFNAAIGNAIGLMQDKIGTLNGNYKKVMGKDAPPTDIVYPDTQAVIDGLKKRGVTIGEGASNTGTTTVTSASGNSYNLPF